MPADASIYNLIRPEPEVQFDPQAAQIKRMRLQELMGNQEAQRMQLDEARRGVQTRNTLQDLYTQDPNPTPEQVGTIDYKAAEELRKARMEAEAKKATTGKSRAETLAIGMKQLRDFTAQAKSDADMPVLRQLASQVLPPEIASKLNIPDRFTPEWQFQSIQTGDQVISSLEAQKGRNVTTRGQDLTAKTAAAGQGVTMRGQDLTRSTAIRGQDLTNARAKEANAVAAGKDERKSAMEAARDLPKVVDQAERAVKLIDEMIGDKGKDLEPGAKRKKPHPGFTSAIGAAIPGLRFIPGSDTADFMARLNEIKGGAFMEAFQSLKGGGQITEVEGQKATQAITRMDNSQSEKEFVKAAREFQDVIRAGVNRARQKAKMPEQAGIDLTKLSDAEIKRELGLK